MRCTRRTLTAVTATMLLAATAACGSGSDSPKSESTGDAGTTNLKIGIIPIVDVAPLYLGQKKGFYKEQGLSLSMTMAQGGAAIVPGVVSGQFQFGFSNSTSLMVAQSKGVPVKVVVNGVGSTGKQNADFGAVVVNKDSPIKSAKDLEGKKVAVNTLKNINDTTVRESVRKDGGDPSKVKFVELAFDQMPAALDKGQIDAAQVVEPATATVKAQGGRVIASNFVDTARKLTVAMYFSSSQYVDQHPDVVKKFKAATQKSLTYANGHPDEVRDIISTYTKIPQSTLDKVTLPAWPAQWNRPSLDTLAKLGEQDGLFEKTPDLDALLP
ncbi:ABC transporter substrate-binding protein [Streptomyces sp. NBC_00006]|uniref:ABC transporter substrate-binding protein n=1 Tax=unclassified Streptomyces TaxID=2593676 RepID=UPI002254AA34|nr:MULTISPECIES: ABC transporter substrate-binding protein [unclassified Streptomyces]MCX4831206.1 ABC transporter substrate-binding protein [Streptomyces sp. NBC_01016]MCX5535723.1 ABC transporter substrate-binding protein [Streptomyces sp. NBC_00006]